MKRPRPAPARYIASHCARWQREPLLFLLVVLLALACHKNAQSPDIKLEYELAPQPARIGAATITLKLAHEDGHPLIGARVELEGNMSHPGMSPVSGRTKEIEPGKYQGQLQLTMAGDWIVLVHITLPNGQRLQRQIEFSVAGSQTHPQITQIFINICVICGWVAALREISFTAI